MSGAYDGKIKVWDLQAALDPRAPAGTLCLRTLVVCAMWFTLFFKLITTFFCCCEIGAHRPGISTPVWRVPDCELVAWWYDSHLGLPTHWFAFKFNARVTFLSTAHLHLCFNVELFSLHHFFVLPVGSRNVSFLLDNLLTVTFTSR